jgi:hypothetical protein
VESTQEEWKQNNGGEEWDASRGVEAIVEKLGEFQEYDYFHDEVKGETLPSSGFLAGRFSAMTIWHKSTLGTFFAGQVFSYTLDNSRPLLFVITKRGEEYTLLINLHAPNKPPISTANYTEIADDIVEKCMHFLSTAGLTMPQITNIYMVGDFNDRYGGLLTEVSRNLFRTRDGPNLPIPVGPYSGEFKLGDKPLTFKRKQKKDKISTPEQSLQLEPSPPPPPPEPEKKPRGRPRKIQTNINIPTSTPKIRGMMSTRKTTK